MTFIQFADADEPNQEERIAKLRAELEKLGGSTTIWKKSFCGMCSNTRPPSQSA
jgi:hypothetical protein